MFTKVKITYTMFDTTNVYKNDNIHCFQINNLVSAMILSKLLWVLQSFTHATYVFSIIRHALKFILLSPVTTNLPFVPERFYQQPWYNVIQLLIVTRQNGMNLY